MCPGDVFKDITNPKFSIRCGQTWLDWIGMPAKVWISSEGLIEYILEAGLDNSDGDRPGDPDSNQRIKIYLKFSERCGQTWFDWIGMPAF